MIGIALLVIVGILATIGWAIYCWAMIHTHHYCRANINCDRWYWGAKCNRKWLHWYLIWLGHD